MSKTTDEQKKGMKYLTYDGVFASVMTAMTSAFVSVFALAMGADNIMIGLLTAIPMIFWTLLQIPSAILSERSGKKMKISLTAGLLARLIWIPIILIPFYATGNVYLLISLITISTAFGAISGPSWARIVANTVPVNMRGRYFSRRNLLSSSVSVLATLFVGWYLDLFINLLSFSIVFTLGLIAGLLSTLYFSRIPSKSSKPRKTPVLKDIKHILKNRPFRRFITIFFVLRFSVMLAAPFMVVDLLKNLGGTYSWIAILAVVTALSGIMMQKRAGKLSDWVGHRPILIVATFGTAFVALGWVFAASPSHIIPINIISGLSWAAFELTFFNYLLEVSPPERRAMFSAITWTITGTAAVIAPLAGSFILNYLITLYGVFGYKMLFFISFLGRLTAAVLFLKFLEEVFNRKFVSYKYVIYEMFGPKLPTGDDITNFTTILKPKNFPRTRIDEIGRNIVRLIKRKSL